MTVITPRVVIPPSCVGITQDHIQNAAKAANEVAETLKALVEGLCDNLTKIENGTYFASHLSMAWSWMHQLLSQLETAKKIPLGLRPTMDWTFGPHPDARYWLKEQSFLYWQRLADIGSKLEPMLEENVTVAFAYYQYLYWEKASTLGA